MQKIYRSVLKLLGLVFGSHKNYVKDLNQFDILHASDFIIKNEINRII